MDNKKIQKFISKGNLEKVLGRLSEGSHLVAPVNISGSVVFQEVDSVNDIVFEYENCLNAPKDYVLLNDEAFFTYDLKRLKIKEDKDFSPEITIFGSRPCDTKAMGLLDKFFSRKFEDPLYFKKRNNILIITLVCQKMGQNCFCASTHSGPHLEDGFDVQLVDIGSGYFLETSSSRGRRFVKRFSAFMDNAAKDKKAKKNEAVEKAKSSKKPDFILEKVRNNLNSMDIKPELWEDLSQRCQSCGGCLLICPTCSCFYVVDKKINDRVGRRVRSLDACYYESFTRMAGPYNPVRPKNAMMKRKFYHKLHQQIDEFGEPGCTGCGRCNEICPGNINWLDVIRSIEQRA